MSEGCFDPGDVAGLLRDLWVSYAGSGGRRSDMGMAQNLPFHPLRNQDSWATPKNEILSMMVLDGFGV